MIRAVTFTNYLGDSIRLDLARPEESGFIIKSVTGLGPGKANINTTEIATNDGSLFNSSRMPSRNIVISLAYMLMVNKEAQQNRTRTVSPAAIPSKANYRVKSKKHL